MSEGIQRITVEVDDETIRDLSVLGEPVEVLARLAHAAADGVRGPGRPNRARTDKSLLGERDEADRVLGMKQTAIEAAADAVVRLARQRADRVTEVAREGTAADASSERARTTLENERSIADAVLEVERATGKQDRTDTLTRERGETDRDLAGERVHLDSLIVDQREANENLLVATFQADAAKTRAEESASTLREVAEFREQFIGILGHDLRNPLASIVMCAGLMLRRGARDDRDATMISRIIRSCERMTRMITQLLDLTRARLGGGLPIEPRQTDLREVCRGVVEEFEADIRLEIEGDVTGSWDPDRLAEALSNLAGNAVEYGAPGSVVVKARAEAAETVVEVTNRGEPIPASALPHLFEPFRRGKPRDRSPRGNLGLGLYIAKQIVLAHGGTLDVRTGEGTTSFIVRLPRGDSSS